MSINIIEIPNDLYKIIYTNSFLGINYYSTLCSDSEINMIFKSGLVFDLMQKKLAYNIKVQFKVIEIIGNVIYTNSQFADVSLKLLKLDFN
jgi:hypothetical protein